MLGSVGRSVVAGKSEQYAAFTLAISFSLMRSRWPMTSPLSGRFATIVALPLMEKAVAP